VVRSTKAIRIQDRQDFLFDKVIVDLPGQRYIGKNSCGIDIRVNGDLLLDQVLTCAICICSPIVSRA
jgi:hypothetical protein